MRKSLILIVALLIGAGSALADWEKGVAAFQKGDFQTAVKDFQELVAQQESFQGHYMLGLSLGRLNRKEEALNHLRKAYDLNPNDLSVKLELARAYMSVRRYGDSARLLGTLSSADLGKLDAAKKKALYQMRAASREQSGDDNGAYSDYKSLADLSPRDAKVQFKYAILAASYGDNQAALTGLDRASNLAPKDQDIKRHYVNLLKKQGRMTRDKTAKKRAYLKAVNVSKQLVAISTSYDNILLKCEAELGATLYADAVTSCQQAVSKKPGDWLAHYYLGQAYSSNKQYKESVGPLEEAFKLASPANRKNVQKQRGFVFEKQKKYSESIAAYEAAGDAAGVARVKDNEATALENQKIEQQNEEIERMRKEAEALEAELRKLEEGGGR